MPSNINEVCYTPLDQAFTSLRDSGHTIGSDKTQRLREFGISSKRIGRRYYFSDATMQRLSYLLNLETAFGLGRNHNALALELAYRRYPVVPWKRVHIGARDAVCHLFNMIDREIQRMTGKKTSMLTEHQVIRLSFQLARHLIPDERLDQDISSGLSRELLEGALEIILRAAYLDQDAQKQEVFFLLKSSGLSANDAITVAALLVPLFNELRPTLRIKNNSFRNAIKGTVKISDIKHTIESMRELRPFVQAIATALNISSKESLDDYPNFSEPMVTHAEVIVIGRAFFYAATRWALNHEKGKATLQQWVAGDSQIKDIVSEITSIRSSVPQSIGKQYE